MNEGSPEPSEVTWEYYTGPGSVSRRRLKQDNRPKPHVCDVCDRAFDRPSALLQHGHTHTGERPHLCPVCKQKRFATTSNLYRHSRTCKGAKSDFIAVSYGERLLGASEYGPPNAHRSDPISDPTLGNVVIRQRLFPTHTHSDDLLQPLSDKQGIGSGGAVTDAYRLHSNLPSSAITPKVEENDSQEPYILEASTTSSRSSTGRVSSSPKSRAPPLFSARRPKPPSDVASDAFPLASNYPSRHLPPSSNLINQEDPTQESQITPLPYSEPRVISNEQYHPPQHSFSAHITPTLPSFSSSFPPELSPNFDTITGPAIPSIIRPPLGTSLKWADEAKKTRRTTPLQKR